MSTTCHQNLMHLGYALMTRLRILWQEPKVLSGPAVTEEH